MGFSYLKDKAGNELNWSNVTRDERCFCADLYFQLHQNKSVKDFTEKLIEEAGILGVDKIDEVELGIEVAYYRDVIFNEEYHPEKSHRKKFANKKSIQGLLKRTFDLCVFLPKDIIIIEAKAAESLTNKQMLEFKYDKEAIEVLHKEMDMGKVNVHLVGLVSDEYSPSRDTEDLFKRGVLKKGIFKWSDIERFNVGYKMPNELKTVYSRTSQLRTSQNMIAHNVIKALKNIEDRRKMEFEKLKKK